MTRIFVDAGHGGKDSGTVGNGLKEKDIVLDICKRIQTGLKNYENVEVIMSRESDVFLSLEQRTDKANAANADVFLAVHCNGVENTTAKGFETYRYSAAGSATIAFQNTIHQEIIRAMGTSIVDRGKKTANFHVLRESKMKAVLTENLFISNSADAKLLSDPDFRQKIANGHIIGLEKFLGLRKIERPPKPVEKYYKVQVGAFEDKAAAEALANDLTRQGYRPYIKYE